MCIKRHIRGPIRDSFPFFDEKTWRNMKKLPDLFAVVKIRGIFAPAPQNAEHVL